MKRKTGTPEVSKPFLTGASTDENTVRHSFRFLGIFFLIVFVSFLVCSMTGFKSAWLRIIVNIVIECLIACIVFTKGEEHGTEDVARGEILYQHQEKGQEIAGNERRIPYHPLKGFLIGLFGTIPFLICAILLALTAEKVMTDTGLLPSWTESFMRRSEIRDALVQYSQRVSISFTDILRIIVRMGIMPFVSLAGSENKDLLFLFERISPVLVLIPALFYGIGYTCGPARRSMVHSQIAENAKKQRAKERRARKQRLRKNVSQGPQQLN